MRTPTELISAPVGNLSAPAPSNIKSQQSTLCSFSVMAWTKCGVVVQTVRELGCQACLLGGPARTAQHNKRSRTEGETGGGCRSQRESRPAERVPAMLTRHAAQKNKKGSSAHQAKPKVRGASPAPPLPPHVIAALEERILSENGLQRSWNPGRTFWVPIKRIHGLRVRSGSYLCRVPPPEIRRKVAK